MFIGIAVKHPQWKLLFDVIGSALSIKRVWTYGEIQEAMIGLDPQSASGRAQVHRCIRELRSVHDMHLECVRGIGYRVVRANEHLECSARRVVQARRKIQTAHHIAAHTDTETLSPLERAALEHAVLRLSTQVQTMRVEAREIKRLSAGRLPSPLLDAAKTG